MTGRGDPPEGAPDGIPGGDDEYRSVVFDESFVRAARIQEFSATERMRSDARAVRTRGRLHGSVSRQAFALILLIALAFGTAVYMGIRHPYRQPDTAVPTQATMAMIPLAPARGGEPPTGAPRDLFKKGPASQYRVGADGIALPAVRRTDHFSVSQVLQAAMAAKEYLVASSINPDVLMSRQTRPVRRMLAPEQQAQFDRSLTRPADDGRHAATGWMVRFDPAKVKLADQGVRVDGSIQVRETDADSLQVTTDHTFVYAVGSARGDGKADKAAALYTVRRELRLGFDRTALRESQPVLLESSSEAGPQLCSVDASMYFQPVLPGTLKSGGDPGKSGGTDPFDHDKPVGATCGQLAAGAQG
ncbi:SCO2583 family membrane protein [Wenjunlia tyrosinilytica]|uniref:Uncharacterized protein n=1 Tax=Wenjunlia tyrosinilytica TaxID=1544741 RepID=A0A917ZE66_9ACTN|nr:hypothetical protein [Wenjunlia tyrosinilytica]GGO80842.1 hypothetical protein GCM10012280_03700 [Wenjunlia tyrosinilytica]